VAKSKRRRRRASNRGRTRGRTRRLLLIAVLVVVVAGFLARRVLVPQARYLLTHRPPPHAEAQNHDLQGAGGPEPQKDKPAEELSNSDRRHLDDIINHKLK
jgi:hypothetical protein